MFGSGSGPILLESLECNGGEQSLAECGHDGWGVHNCQHNEDVAISCEPEESTTAAAAVTHIDIDTLATTGKGIGHWLFQSI